jgi:hypothetical protein
MEDFEDEGLAIRPNPPSDTGIVQTFPTNAPEAFLDQYSQYSGISYLDNDASYLQLVSDNGDGGGFVFDRGDFIFLELHYKINIPLVVGLYIKLDNNTVENRPFLIVNSTDVWKKIYVNFTPIVNETVDAVDYTIYFQAELSPTDASAEILLDNIKLISRPNL